MELVKLQQLSFVEVVVTFPIAAKNVKNHTGKKDTNLLAKLTKSRFIQNRHSIYIWTVNSYALSFYRSKNVLGWSKLFTCCGSNKHFVPDKNTYGLHSVKLSFVPAQKFLKKH